MNTRALICILLLCCGPVSRIMASGPAGRRARHFYHVERLDTVSGEWRRHSVTARIAITPETIEIIIWNNWADPRINPLTRLVLALPPQWDTLRGLWRYPATAFRFENPGKSCYVESCTKLADTSNPDFTIREAGRTARYRISRKEHRKP